MRQSLERRVLVHASERPAAQGAAKAGRNNHIQL